MTGATWLAIGWLAASAPGSITLSIERCPHLDVGEVKRLLAIELSAEIVDTGGDVQASMRCEDELAHLAYRDQARTIDLSRIDARARPRLIALALAELATKPVAPPPPPPQTPSIPERTETYDPPPIDRPIDPPSEPPVTPPVEPPAATPIEPPAPPKVEPPPPIEPPAVVSSSPATSATTSTDLHFAASVLGGLTLFTSEGPPAFGGRASVEIAPSAFGGRFDAGAYFGSESADLGHVSLLLADVGLSGFGRFIGGIVLFDVSVGARIGFARLRGSPEDPSAIEGLTITGVWAGPFLGGRSTFRLGPVLIVADVEAGLVIRPVVGTAAGSPIVSADGAWFGFHLGLGLEP